MNKVRLSGKAVLVGVGVLGIGLTGGGLAIAADLSSPDELPVDGSAPTDVTPGTAIPLDDVPVDTGTDGVTTVK